MKRRKFLSSSLLAAVPVTIPGIKLTEFLSSHIELTSAAGTRRKSNYPPMDAPALYGEMERVCGSVSMGCAINMHWMIDQTLRLIRGSVVSAFLNQLNLQTANPKVGVGISIDTTNIQLVENSGKIVLTGFKPSIVLKESGGAGRTYNSVGIIYEPVELKIENDVYNPQNLVFHLAQQKPIFHIPDKTTNLNSNVVKDNFSDPNEYVSVQDLVLFTSNAIALLDAFVKSIKFPPIVQAARTFMLQSPYKYSFIANYIIVHSIIGVSPKEDCGGGDGFRTDVVMKPTATSNSISNGDIAITYKRTMEPLVVKQDRLINRENIEDPEFALYYPHTITFQALINSTLQPAISVADKGGFLAFQWFYSLTAALKNGVSGQINTSTKTIDVKFPFGITGIAGIGVEIACVYVPVADVSFIGDIDPCNVRLSLEITKDANGVALYAKPDLDATVEIKFVNFLHLEIILNALMGSLGNKLVTDKLKNEVNKLNFKLFDFTASELSTPSGWDFVKLVQSDSLFAAFKSNDG